MTLLAALPILVVLGLMLFRQWGAQRAGPAGWLAGLIVAALFFGLTPQVLWVSQLKGLFLSLFVLAVLWPALLLYNVVDQIGGIRALSQGLQRAITDRGLLLIVLAWAFSGMLQGLAGFGLPIAIVAPMLIALDVSPVVAVAAVAIGHSWAVTFGDMGVVFQTLTGLVEIDSLSLAPHAALMLGAACLGCGLSAAYLLGQGRRWLELLVLAALMGIAQYALAVSSVMPLAAFGAGLAGMLGGVLLSRRHNQVARESDRSPIASPSLLGALGSYGALAGLMSAVALIVPLRTALYPIVWQISFPEVSTTTGFVTSAGTGQALRPFVHPGSAIFLIACFSYLAYRRLKWCAPGSWRRVAAATWRSAAPASVGIVTMVGLATLMDHTGMTLLLAQTFIAWLGLAYPVASSLVGMLGAFATGGNNNSNVLLASLQKNAALLLSIDPRVLLAAQTTGGALGSMIAPAKLIVGCSTVGLKRRDGEVLRRTLLPGLLIGLGVGVLAFLLSRL